MIIGKEYGGLDFSAAANSHIVARIATGSLKCRGERDGSELFGTRRVANALRNHATKGALVTCIGEW